MRAQDIKGLVRYESPREVYLRDNAPYAGGTITQYELIGETKLSWVSGPDYCAQRHPKKQHEIVSEEAYQQRQWVLRHARAISHMICPVYARPDIAYDKLRQIAELVGYVEATA